MGKIKVTRCGKTVFEWGRRTFIMGIINVSPDSFSGDGIATVDGAVAQARRFVDEGADILDVGGESTRPNSRPLLLEEEMKRVIPAVELITGAVTVPVSIDTMKYEVAVRALAVGAAILNDQRGLKKEPRLAQLAAEKGTPIILMSNQRDRGGYDTSAERDTGFYPDIMAAVLDSLRYGITSARAAGVPEENIVVDPGIGFGKTWQQDIEIMRRLRELTALGYPILIGTSRKSLIKMVLDLPAADRVEGTSATVAIGIANGADIVRVHDVKQMARVCKMADAIVRGV